MGERRRVGSPPVVWGSSPKPGRVTAGEDFSFAFQIRKPVRQQTRASPVSTPKRTLAKSPPVRPKEVKVTNQRSGERLSAHGDLFLKYLEDLKSRINADVRGARASCKSSSPPPAETRGNEKQRHRRMQSDAKPVERSERQSPVSRLLARMEDLGNSSEQSHRRNASMEVDHSVHVESPLNLSDEKTVKRGFHSRSSSSSKIGEEAKEMAGSGSSASLVAAEEDKEQLMRIVKLSYRSSGVPPTTTSDFYRFGRMLGKGAFGKVSLAIHKLTGLKVAIKSIDKAYMKDEHRRRKVFQEVFTMRRIRHHNVVRLFEVFESSRHFNMVLEYCGGGDLLHFVKTRGKLPESEAKLIFYQVTEAISACQSRGIVHRDIKLDNILMDTRLTTAKLCDFGVSRMAVRGQRISDQCGTPAYIAPEIIVDCGYDAFYVDLWSMGVMLYAMVVGTVPFRAGTLPELHKLILRGKYVLPDHLSPELQHLIAGLLQLVPHNRLQLEEILVHPWFSKTIDETQVVDSETLRFTGRICAHSTASEPTEQVDQRLISQLERYGLPAEFTWHCLRLNEINHATATYELLAAAGETGN